MPTGYTAPIYEGKKDYTFEKFAIRCARSFGACVGLRDEPLDMEIDLDKHFQPSDYYKKELEGSLNFDCGNYKPVIESREEYIDYRLSTNRFTREIEHYRESYQKEVDACNERREWVKQLMDSLK